MKRKLGIKHVQETPRNKVQIWIDGVDLRNISEAVKREGFVIILEKADDVVGKARIRIARIRSRPKTWLPGGTAESREHDNHVDCPCCHEPECQFNTSTHP